MSTRVRLSTLDGEPRRDVRSIGTDGDAAATPPHPRPTGEFSSNPRGDEKGDAEGVRRG